MTHISRCAVCPARQRAAWHLLAPQLLTRVFAAMALHRQHIALSRLDDALLRDIGLTRFDANTEAKRTVWDAPTHWRE